VSATPERGPARCRLAWLAPALGYAGLIFWLSAQSHPLPELTELVWDKALHALEYAGLAGLLALGLDQACRLAPWRSAAWAAGLASLYGASDELHQAFVPARASDLEDWAADTVGALAAAVLAALVLRHLRARASIRS
jgi:VanZ family protein